MVVTASVGIHTGTLCVTLRVGTKFGWFIYLTCNLLNIKVYLLSHLTHHLLVHAVYWFLRRLLLRTIITKTFWPHLYKNREVIDMTDNKNTAGNRASDYQGILLEISTTPKKHDFILNRQEQQASPNILRQIWQARQFVYNKIYPDVITFSQDLHDAQSCVIYTRNAADNISSTARIAFNIAPLGIPEKKLVPALIEQLNQEHKVFAELGRFVIDDEARGVLKNYYRTFYQLGIQQGIDTYIMFVRPKWVNFYRRLMKANIVAELDETFGSDSTYVVMTWHLQDTTARFFSWSGIQKSNTNKCQQESQNEAI